MVLGLAKETSMRPSPLSPRLKSKPLIVCSGINARATEFADFTATGIMGFSAREF